MEVVTNHVSWEGKAVGSVICMSVCWFLPRDSYAKRGICRRRVSVCLSVCHTPVLYQNG